MPIHVSYPLALTLILCSAVKSVRSPCRIGRDLIALLAQLWDRSKRRAHRVDAGEVSTNLNGIELQVNAEHTALSC